MTKRLFFSAILLGYIAVAQRLTAQTIAEERLADFFYKEGNIFDFKEVPEGPPAIHVFEFVNKGKMPLVITNASAECGCAVASWTDEPVLPGDKGVVTVQYNTDGRVGPFKREIFIRSNAKSINGVSVLSIKGAVQAKEPELPATGYTKE